MSSLTGQTGAAILTIDGVDVSFTLGDMLYEVPDGNQGQIPTLYYDSRLEHTLRSAEGSSARLLACVAQPPRARSGEHRARTKD